MTEVKCQVTKYELIGLKLIITVKSTTLLLPFWLIYLIIKVWIISHKVILDRWLHTGEWWFTLTYTDTWRWTPGGVCLLKAVLSLLVVFAVWTMHERCLMLRQRMQTSSPLAGREGGTPCMTSCRVPPTPRAESCPSPCLCPSCTSMQEGEVVITN